MIKYDEASKGNKLLRLFQRLLVDGKKHYQSDLAKWLNCSHQTIIRLISEIEGVIGANLITGLDGRNRWYKVNAVSNRTLGLNYEELRYMSLCRELADPYLPEQVKNRVDSSIFKMSVQMADCAMPQKDGRELKYLSSYNKGRIDYTAYYDTISQLVGALENSQICMITYRSLNSDKTSEYRILPVRIASMNNALYILGAKIQKDWETVDKQLSLAIHRIKNVVITDRILPCPDIVDEPDSFGLPWHEPRKFKIRFSAGRASEYVRERIWSDNQLIHSLPDGGIILEITSRSQPELEAWVRSFGDRAEFIDNN